MKLTIPQWEQKEEVEIKRNILIPSHNIRIKQIKIDFKFYAFEIRYHYKQQLKTVKDMICEKFDNIVALIRENHSSYVYYAIYYGSENDHDTHKKTSLTVM